MHEALKNQQRLFWVIWLVRNAVQKPVQKPVQNCLNAFLQRNEGIMNKQDNFAQTGLKSRGQRYALVIRLLFAKQGLTGKLSTVNRGARHLSYGVRLNDPMQLDNALKLAEPMALSCGVKNILSQRLGGMVGYQIELPGMYWQYFTRQDLPNSKSVGLAEQKRAIAFELDPPHSLIAGTSGSGKSETLKSILVSLMTSYSPLELGIILIDPHCDYQDFSNEAHLIMPIATEASDINRALAYVNQELAYRKAENIKDGRVVILAIDEADSVLSGSNLEIAKQISKQARKYRIHLLVATQKPMHGDLPGILDNLMNKFIGQLSDAKTSANVTGHAGLMAHKLTPKGDFLHISGPDVLRFQVAMATSKDYDKLPRTEIQPVEVVTNDVIELPSELPISEPGRPGYQLNPQYLAWYFYHNPEKITRRMAQELLGMGQRGHELHKEFCREFIKAYLELRQANLPKLGA